MKTEEKRALKTLAGRYPQLYLDPDKEGAHEACLAAVRQGIMPEECSLRHFHGDERDRLETVETPAGPVDVLTLFSRTDFETCLRILAYHCGDAVIPETQGASTLDGIVNWPRIREHRERFFREQALAGIADPDWSEEFRAFTSVRSNYRDVLIVLSVGPYSGVPAEEMGLPEEEWIRASYTIRKYHECTHVICRRLYPEMIDAVWDELTADAVGICAAFGRFDIETEERFLGIRDGRYAGGRLQNYVKDSGNREELDRLAGRAAGVLKAFVLIIREAGTEDPFGLIPVLQAQYGLLWKTNRM